METFLIEIYISLAQFPLNTTKITIFNLKPFRAYQRCRTVKLKFFDTLEQKNIAQCPCKYPFPKVAACLAESILILDQPPKPVYCQAHKHIFSGLFPNFVRAVASPSFAVFTRTAATALSVMKEKCGSLSWSLFVG